MGLLLLELFFKLCKFLHCNLFFWVEDLLYAFYFFCEMSMVCRTLRSRGLTYIMTQHAFDPVLECDGRGIAGTTSASKFQQNLTIDETFKVNVASVFLDGGSNASFEQFFDHAYDFAIVFVIGQRVALGRNIVGSCSTAVWNGDYGLTRSDCFGDETEYFWLDVWPAGTAVFGDCNIVCAVKDCSDAIDREQLCSEW